jgi:hypothetical protein
VQVMNRRHAGHAEHALLYLRHRHMSRHALQQDISALP